MFVVALESGPESMPHVVSSMGATAVFDYHRPLDQQVGAIEKATSGKPINKIFDATSAYNPELAKVLFKKADGTKLFSTTNDWSGIGDFEGGKTYEIHLGQLGRPVQWRSIDLSRVGIRR